MKTCKKTYLTPRGESATVSPDATALRFTFTNGKSETIEFAKVPANIHEAAFRHGMSQKLGDSYASSQTVGDAYQAFCDMRDQLLGGEWNTRSEGTGGDLVAAVVRVQKITDEKAREALTKLDGDKIKALRKNPKIAAALAAIKAERAKAAAKDTDGSELDKLLAI